MATLPEELDDAAIHRDEAEPLRPDSSSEGYPGTPIEAADVRNSPSTTIPTWKKRLSDLTYPIQQSETSEDSHSVLSSTRSLRESIFEYIRENGRTYAKYGTYFLPNDQPESERLNTQYIVLKRLFGDRDHFAPLKDPRRILDIGTGTGIWCSAMGEEFPNATVIGTDLSPIQETVHPDNVSFLIEDASDENWGRQNYDYIHTRMMLGSFNDFRVIIQRALDNLEPGGWMESQEVWPTVKCDDDSMDRETNKLCEWTKWQDEAAMRMGMPLRIANKLARWYREAGFVDVHEEIFKMPIGGWPKDPQYKLLGKWWGRSLLDGLQGFTLHLFTRAFGWNSSQVEVYLVDVRKAVLDKRTHAYHDIHVVWGRKPTVEEQRILNEKKATAASAKQPDPSPSSSSRSPPKPEQQPPPGSASNGRPKAPFSASPHPHNH